MDETDIIEALRRLDVPHEEIGKAIGRNRSTATKIFYHDKARRIKVSEIPALLALIAKYERIRGERAQFVTQSQVEGASPLVRDYVEVEILPTYAGMGGGGTGVGERATALLPRRLVEDELHAKPTDLLVIDVRGDSMEPLFLHGDQIVVDRRDTNPVQPGPFALWYDDGYVVKNVERIRKTGRLRIFSSNPTYSPDEADPDDVTIMGRPVWYARRL
jgi:phage repressor protein C with HTH and peptisase S24 domain